MSVRCVRGPFYLGWLNVALDVPDTFSLPFSVPRTCDFFNGLRKAPSFIDLNAQLYAACLALPVHFGGDTILTRILS